MPKKISKILSHAKNRLSGSGSGSSGSGSGGSSGGRSKRKSESSSGIGGGVGGGSLAQKQRTSIGSTSDSSRLLQDYDDDSGDGLHQSYQQQTSVSTASTMRMVEPGEDYDDFESPDLNLGSLNRPSSKEQQQQQQGRRQSTSEAAVSMPQSTSNENPSSSTPFLLGSLPSKNLLRNLFSSFSRNSGNNEAGGNTAGYNELYTEHQQQEEKDSSQKYWWQSDFLLGTETYGPVLFGTWNGVFVTTVVHLFGVISFLRIGWMVGNEGVPLSMAIVFGCLLFNTISLLAAIGIMERCAAATTSGYGPFHHTTGVYGAGGKTKSNRTSNTGNGNDDDPEYPYTVATARANVHILIATVLGSRIGGAISLIYCIGQAVSCALHVTGFSETFVHLFTLLLESKLISSQEQQRQHHHHSSSASPSSSSWSSISGFNDTDSILARTIVHLLAIEEGSTETELASSSSSLLSSASSASIPSAMNHQHQITSSSTTETMKTMIQLIPTTETFRLVSIGLILILFIFNIIGVRWLFRLQTLLFLALVMAVGDFSTGLFVKHSDDNNNVIDSNIDNNINGPYGSIRASPEHFQENLYPNLFNNNNNKKWSWQFWRKLFEVIGVFFPATIGVMAGVNMGSDLERPTKSIPIGSFMAIISSYAVHVLFILGLALTCTRWALLNDYAIAQHVSAVGIFFSFGLYMSTISSGLGSMYTAPRIMQNLAQELHSVPIVRCFARGRGPNNIPIHALVLFTLITIGFIMIGGINVLAPIVTIPYLLTYAAIEYAYFSMAMTFDIQIQREKRFMQIATQLKSSDTPPPAAEGGGSSSGIGSRKGSKKLLGGPSPSTKMLIDNNEQSETTSLSNEQQLIFTTPAAIGTGKIKKNPSEDTISLTTSLCGGTSGGGGNNGGNNGTGGGGTLSPSPSLQHQHLAGYGSIQSITQHIKIKRRQSTQSSDSDGEDQQQPQSQPQKQSQQVTSSSMTSIGSGKQAKAEMKLSTKNNKTSASSDVKNNNKNKKDQKVKTIKQLMAAVSNSEEDEEEEEEEEGGQETEKAGQEEYYQVDNADDDDDDDDVLVQSSRDVGDDEINQQTKLGYRYATAATNDEDEDPKSKTRRPQQQQQQHNDNYIVNENYNENDENQACCERLLMPDPELAEIACKKEVWYLRLMNRWIVLIAAILKLILMFVIAWHYALITILMFALFYLIIGKTNPGFYPGVSEFSLINWLRNCCNFCKRWKAWRRSGAGYSNVGGGANNETNLIASYSYDQIILPETVMPDFHYESDQLTKEGTDYMDRPPCHYTTTINRQLN